MTEAESGLCTPLQVQARILHQLTGPLIHHLWELITHLGTSSLTHLPWRVCSVLPLSLRSVISKDKSPFTVLLCPRQVAQILAVKQSSKAADGILRDQREKGA